MPFLVRSVGRTARQAQQPGVIMFGSAGFYSTLPNLFYTMKKSLLIIQFRENKKKLLSEKRSFLRCFKNTDIKLHFFNGIDKKVNWKNSREIMDEHMGVILCGSSNFDFDGGRTKNDPKRKMSYNILRDIKPFLKYLFNNNIPTLGICYGHQMLGAFLGVKVVNDKKQSKLGSFEISLIDNLDPLLKNLPNKLMVQYGHKDSLDKLPKGSKVIAKGQKCKFATVKHTQNMYGVQFHPELKAEDFIKELKKNMSYLPDKTEIKSLIKSSIKSELILRNFAGIAMYDYKKIILEDSICDII